jgi:hypothetical protein
MASDYVIQIVHVPTRSVVIEWEPRAGGLSLGQEIASRVVLGNILQRSEANIKQSVVKAAQDFLLSLKKQV